MTITAAALAGFVAPLIVAVWLVQSTLQSAGEHLATAPDSLPFTFHDPALPLPDLGFSDSEGRAVTLADFGGRVVLFNLWATWCGPCLHELPSLDRLQAVLGGTGFTVVALSQDRAGLAEVGPYWERAGLDHLTVYVDDGMAAGRAIGALGLPTTLLIGRDGRELGRLEGPAEWDSPAALNYFRTLEREP